MDQQLVFLIGLRELKQLIDLLIEYAREYCGFLPGVAYSTNTVVVAAMSGVAATLLMGETTHSALLLNRKKDIDAEKV